MRTLYRASHVRTQSHPAIGEWLLVDERHVQRVGSAEAPAADRVVDLPGTTIVPGFIDTHVHLTGTGMQRANEDVTLAGSAQELLAIARDRAVSGEGTVLLGGFDETRWDRPTHPTLADLDASTDRPLVIRRADGHLALANTSALHGSGALEEPGVERGPDGEPTGRLTQAANARVWRWASAEMGDLQIQDLQLKGASLAAERGVTTIHEMSMPQESGIRDLQVFLNHRSKLPVDSVVYVATTDIPQAIDLGFASIGGDLPVDGSIGARTAALISPYADADGAGAGYFADDELGEFFHAGHGAGLQVGVHAIGDRAIDQVLSAWERVYQALDSRERRHFRARRHRVDHFEMAGAPAIERAAMLGLAVSVQPAFDLIWGRAGGLYETALGPERAASMNPFRTMLDRGVELGAASDAPVTALDPMLALEAFETHHDPSQRLSRFEAIRVLTIGGARLAHQEEKKGVLEPGMHADFAAFDEDPFEAPSVGDLRPILTVSLGREVFAA